MALPGARAWLIPFVEPPSSRGEAFRLTNAVVGREGLGRGVLNITIPWTLNPWKNEGFTPQNMGYNP